MNHTWNTSTRCMDSRFVFHVFHEIKRPNDIRICYQVIEALCCFMNEDAPSPLPSDSTSKVIRRALFRRIFCPTMMSCDKLKSLIRHLIAMFEEYHDDVRADLFRLLFAALRVRDVPSAYSFGAIVMIPLFRSWKIWLCWSVKAISVRSLSNK